MLKSRGVLNGYLITLLLQGKFGLVWWGQTIKGILELDEGKNSRSATWKAGGRLVGTYNSYILVVHLEMLRCNWE